MEDKKKKKDDKRIKETSQKVPEQNVKVPESTKPSCSQQPTTPTSVSPSPGPIDPSPPNSSATGFSAPVLPGGGNNAKQRTAVANGQPSSLSGNQTPQQQRYMSREVPPRFRCQQDHKVLLKRGQPPLSSMLLGGGGGDESTGGVGVGSGWGAAPPLSSKEADNSNANTDTDSNLGSSSPSPPNTASSSGVIALSLSSSSTNSTYANSTWGAGSVSLPPSQGCDKIIVDGTDLDSWPSIQGTAKLSSDGSGGRVQQQDGPGNKNSSASFHEKNLQQIGGVAEGGAGKVYNPSPPFSSPLSSFSSQNECVQTGGVMWSSSTSPRAEAGLGSAAFYNSKVSHLLPGPQESPADSNSSLPSSILNPNVNPSAWPALVQGKTSTSATSLHLSSVPASTTSLPHEHTETAELDTSTEQQHPLGNFEQELDSGEGAQGAGPGPNREDGDKRETESGAEGEGSVHRCGPLSSSSAVSSSLKPLTAVPSAPRAGAPQEDHWGGHDTEIHEQDKNLGGFGNQGDNTGWGRESANIETLSQGVWKDGSSAVDCGDTDECVSSNNLAIASATGGCGSNNNNNNSEGGGGSALPGSASPKLAMMENAWDNQKGMESGHVVQQQGQGAGGEGQASSSGDGTKNDGEKGTGNGQKSHGAQSVLALSNQTSDAEVALLGMLNRSDLDPRVLSNTGWGQTQIRQNVAWDLNTTKQVGHRNEKMSSSSTFSSGTMPPNNRSSGFILNSRLNSNDEPDNVTSGPASVRDSWDGGGPQVTSGSHMSDGVLQKPKMPDKEDSPGNATRSWGDPPPENQGKGWGDEHQWGDHRGGNWRDKGEQSSGWPVGPEDKRTGGWKGTERGKVGGWGDWGQGESKPGGGWGDGRFRGSNSSDEVSSWGNPDEGAPQRGGWGEGDVVKSPHDWGGSQPHAAGPTPNNQVAAMKTPNQHHQSQGHHPPGRTLQGGWDSRPNVGSGGPPSKNQNQGSGWISGPIPQISGDDSVKPSGWDEPSPQSISHKMEIDDGTSAWGDPTNYNGKNVNLWDKNRAPSGESHSQQASALQPTRRHQGLPHRDANAGNAVVGMWGGGTQSLDNGSGAWNQTSDTASGWGDSDDPKMSGWGNLSPNPGKSTKSLETWGGKGDGSVAASRHPSWEEEDDSAVGIWNSTGSQGSSSSFHSGGWSHGGRRGNMKGGSGDSWLNPISRQFSNMGPLGEDPSIDKKMEGDKRGMADYNGDIRRGGRGGGVYRMSNTKDMGPVEMSTYGEKMGSHGMYVGSSGGIHQSRGIHQPGLHPQNPSPGLRAQVPHPFLSAQVPGSMLKQMPSPGGSVLGGVGGVGSVGGAGSVGGGVFPPQISPQQLAVLSNIYPHVQQFHLACQLLLQQQQQQQQQQQFLQNQRKFPQPQSLRQQPDPQQLARIVAILQQQRHQHGGVAAGSSKLSPSHLGGRLSKQPTGDSYPPPGVGGPVSDPHSKMQGVYSGLELGSPMIGAMKDIGGQQSRFKWMMEGHSPAPSPPESTLLKNGSTENWQRTPGSKMGNKTSTSSWPPEFQPGVPWNGMQSSGDPESDPYMTPGSVLGSPGPATLNDSDHQLLRDNIGPNPALNTSLPSHGAWPYSASDSPLSKAHGTVMQKSPETNPLTTKYSEYKSSWPPEPIGQSKSWKADRNSSQLPRPPPGLTNQKQGTPSPWGSVGPRVARSWGGGGVKQDSRFGPGTAWSDGVASRGSSWLLLSNLTPQIDGSTLKTICMQHGPLLTFHLGLTQGSALIRYSSRLEAAKAQGALHMCVLGNTTILAEFLSEEEVSHYFAHCQAAGADVTSTGGAVAAGTHGSPGTVTVVTPSGASSPRSEGAVASTISGGDGSGGGAESGSVGPSGVMSPGSGWQGLDGTSSCSETSSVQGPGLGIFSQWSTNGAGGVGNVGGAESGRSGLWGGMAAGYHGSSLWGAPQMEERHQMDSPAALLPGDLLGSGADSV